MKICLICEGSYPYIAGGVASWVQMLCSNLSDIEFIIWSIATTREEMSEYKYKVPENITEIQTIYLGDSIFSKKHKKIYLEKEEVELLRNLIRGKASSIRWKEILVFFKRKKMQLVDLLMSEYFYEICLEKYLETKSIEPFKEYLWNLRGMYSSLMNSINGEIPEADIYHSLSTGYAGVLGSAASFIEEKPLVLSEHGIYTREREEDIIRSSLIEGGFKQIWIDFFKKLSLISYHQARIVTSLFQTNRDLQVELGCPEEKIQIIPNGVAVNEYKDLESMNKFEENCFNIGTILRVVPIKDVKTMLFAFDIVREQKAEARLYILGGYDENPEYYKECLSLVDSLNIENVYFLGRVNIKEYLPEFDLLLLSSISEGQPLAILEGLAAGKAFVSTNVGDCRDLLEGGAGDPYGRAGYIVPVMDSQAMADAILLCARYPDKLLEMGENGQRRVEEYYTKEGFLQKYRELYAGLRREYNGRDRI